MVFRWCERILSIHSIHQRLISPGSALHLSHPSAAKNRGEASKCANWIRIRTPRFVSFSLRVVPKYKGSSVPQAETQGDSFPSRTSPGFESILSLKMKPGSLQWSDSPHFTQGEAPPLGQVRKPKHKTNISQLQSEVGHRIPQNSSHTVDGRNPFRTTLKPWLKPARLLAFIGESPIQGFLGGANGFCSSTVGLLGLKPSRSRGRLRMPEVCFDLS